MRTKIYLTIGLLVWCWHVSQAQQTPSGLVFDTERNPLMGVTVHNLRSGKEVKTDDLGHFYVESLLAGDTIKFSHVGYRTVDHVFRPHVEPFISIVLDFSINYMEEIELNTGYYGVRKDKATGSFSYLDHAQLNRDVSSDIVSRLEGIAPSLQFDRSHITGEVEPVAQLRLRGVSTINSNSSPLIVVDGFPYEGDLNSLNPSDVASVTLLKDASSSSIWGARAGNGVIVIETARADPHSRIKLAVSSTATLSKKPDLFYTPNRLPSSDWLEIEEYLFNLGNFRETEYTMLPPYVELLIQQSKNLISAEEFAEKKTTLMSNDLIRDSYKYLYREAFGTQHAMQLSGSSNVVDYYFSTGYDMNASHLIGNNATRWTLNNRNTFRISPKLSSTAGIYYTRQHAESNGMTYYSLKNGPANMHLMPYVTLKDPDGLNASIPWQHRESYLGSLQDRGLLDWGYRPLDEINFNDNQSHTQTIRLDLYLNYNPIEFLRLSLKYRYTNSKTENSSDRYKDGYFVRSLVNRFTQNDGTRIIPYNNILVGGEGKRNGHFGRFQVSYAPLLPWEGHTLSFFGGVEMREEIVQRLPGYQVYDYDPDILIGTTALDFQRSFVTQPTGTPARIPAAPTNQAHVTDRFLSAFSNFQYGFKGRYYYSGSLRWDGSNLFGVRANQKGVPLWSVGASWVASNESFWVSDILSYFRMRMTYGVSGNVNNSLSAFPTMTYSTNSTTRLRYGVIRSAGNPDLSWERVKTTNMGFDFTLNPKTVRVSLDFYHKAATNLIGVNVFDPTTGIINDNEISNLVNYADMENRGIDITADANVLNGKLRWDISLIGSILSNKITNYKGTEAYSITSILNGITPVEGFSRDELFALPWYGLDPNNGQPVVMLGGVASQEYLKYISTLGQEDLLPMGSEVPTYHGSITNTLGYGPLKMSFNITGKAGFKFKENAINYGMMFSRGEPHLDYNSRWQSPGDELSTHIPALPRDINSNRDIVYGQSEIVVQDGAHLRLQDVRLSYMVFRGNKRFKTMDVFVYGKQLGLLWTRNKSGLDPDYPRAYYPMYSTYSLGLSFTL